jgi:hypothetical protein
MKGEIVTFASSDDIRNGKKDEHRVVYSQDGKCLYGTVHQGITSYSVHPGTEIICDNAFLFGFSIQSIVISEGVIAIGKQAFAGCNSLSTIDLPSSIEHIGEEPFKFCDNLTEIRIPKGTKEKFEKLLPKYIDKLIEK